MVRYKLLPNDHMYDKRGNHITDPVSYTSIFVSEETVIELDDDIAAQTIAYIEENRKNADSYRRKIVRLPSKIPE